MPKPVTRRTANKIPDHATCVFKGVIFDVYQWPQTMFDGSIATFEAIKRPSTVVVLPVMPDGQVCYSKQEQPGKPPFLSLFGGRIDDGEDPLSAAKRELREESGMESADWQLLHELNPPGKIDWNIHYYIAHNCTRSGRQHLDPGERIEVITCTPEHFIEQVAVQPEFREVSIRQMLYSAHNPAAASALLKAIRTGQSIAS